MVEVARCPSAAFLRFRWPRFPQNWKLSSFQNFAGISGSNAIGTPGTRFFQISQVLRDTYQFSVGGNLIWSPVKDLDTGVEALYTQFGVKNGRVIDNDKDPTAYSRIAAINAGGPVRTITSDGVEQFRFRVQRDF